MISGKVSGVMAGAAIAAAFSIAGMSESPRCEEDQACWIASSADDRSWDEARADALASGWVQDGECISYRWSGATLRRCR